MAKNALEAIRTLAGLHAETEERISRLCEGLEVQRRLIANTEETITELTAALNRQKFELEAIATALGFVSVVPPVPPGVNGSGAYPQLALN